MAVAKSYENAEIINLPYEQDGKMYVRIKNRCPRCNGSGRYSYNPRDGATCLKCGGSGIEMKVVRWYTESERASMDRQAEKRAAAKAVRTETNKVAFAARNAFGFGELGFITLYKGDQDVISKFFKEEAPREAWYNQIFHWYTPSKMPVPQNLPEGVETLTLEWDAVKVNDLEMRDNEEVKQEVSKLIYPASRSEYVGEVGGRFDNTLRVIKAIQLEGYYGKSTLHTMEDSDGNIYTWITTARTLEEGSSYHLRGSIKDHNEYQGIKQTILTRLREVK